MITMDDARSWIDPKSEFEEQKAAASAEGFEWRDSQDWYEGRLEGEFIVAPTDKAPRTDSTRKLPFIVRPTHAFEVNGREYAIGKDPTFGVAFARIDG